MKATLLLRFRVDGTPQPRGSKRAITVPGKRGLLIDDNAKSKPWMNLVTYHARLAMVSAGFSQPFDEALALRVIIFRARPKGHFNKTGLKSNAPRFPTTKPDCSKYMRAVEDAMTGVVYVDDARLVDSWPSKRFGRPGVLIELYRLPETATDFTSD